MGVLHSFPINADIVFLGLMRINQYKMDWPRVLVYLIPGGLK